MIEWILWIIATFASLLALGAIFAWALGKVGEVVEEMVGHATEGEEPWK